MKSHGSTLAFTRQRNEALLRAYRKEAGRAGYIRLSEIGYRIVNSPAPRFWVSEERASAVVSAIFRGKPVLASMRPMKREMFREIARRVRLLKRKRPKAALCLLVSEVIHSPAPKYYMEPRSAIERLFKIRNGWYER